MVWRRTWVGFDFIPRIRFSVKNPFSLNPSTRKSAVLDAITSYLVRPLYIFQGFCEKDGVRKPFGPHTPDELIQWANNNTPADLEDTRLCLDVVSNGEVVSHLHIGGVVRHKFQYLIRQYR